MQKFLWPRLLRLRADTIHVRDNVRLLGTSLMTALLFLPFLFNKPTLLNIYPLRKVVQIEY